MVHSMEADVQGRWSRLGVISGRWQWSVVGCEENPTYPKIGDMWATSPVKDVLRLNKHQAIVGHRRRRGEFVKAAKTHLE